MESSQRHLSTRDSINSAEVSSYQGLMFGVGKAKASSKATIQHEVREDEG